MIINFLRNNYARQFYNNQTIEKNVINLLPNCIKSNYIPISTPPDGSCLWHMISLSYFGNTNYTQLLRMLSVYYIIYNKYSIFNILEKYYKHLPTNNKEDFDVIILNKYKSLLLDARKFSSWGNEFHLLIIATFLNIKIYIYSPISEYNLLLLNDTEA